MAGKILHYKHSNNIWVIDDLSSENYWFLIISTSTKINKISLYLAHKKFLLVIMCVELYSSLV